MDEWKSKEIKNQNYIKFNHVYTHTIYKLMKLMGPIQYNTIQLFLSNRNTNCFKIGISIYKLPFQMWHT